jgi:hypothetical protein
LAFIGRADYTHAFQSGGIEPGDEFAFSLETVLAASPETSLRLALDQVFSGKVKVNNDTVAGSDQNSTVLTLGASSILGRGVLLSVNAGIGLTDDAPDYFINVSLPIRFDTPIP